MGEWSSRSSDSDSDFSRRRARQRRSLNSERGVVKREAWADDSGSGSSTDTERDRSDDIPLAQTEIQPDASNSEEDQDSGGDSDTTMGGEKETEDVDIRVKTEEAQDPSAHSESDDKETEESDAAAEDDGEETEDVGIRVKAEATSAENKSASDDDMAPSFNEDDGNYHVIVADEEDEEADADDASVLVLSDAHHPARKTSSRRILSKKAADDSKSEWTPEEDEEDEDEETQLSIQDDQPAPRGKRQRKHREEEEEEVAAHAEEEEEEGEEKGEDAPEPIGRQDFNDASKMFVQLKRAYLPSTEGAALWDGGFVSGPPVDRPLSQADQWRRKYRWPVAMRNIRRRNFIADPKDLSHVYDVPLCQDAEEPHGPSAAAREAFAAALAPTVRPLMETAIATSQEQSRKRRREAGDGLGDSGEPEDAVDLTWLRTVTRLGGHYTDQLLDSLLVKTALSLQGIDASYPQQCWDPLPTSKRPIANWRFVLEHFCKSSTHGVDAPVASPSPKLRRDTLIRIRDRLRTLFGLSWRPEDDEFFNLVDRQELDPPDFADTEILQL